MKDTVRTVIQPGFNWPTLRDCQPPLPPPKPRVIKPKAVSTKPKKKCKQRTPPVLTGQIVLLPTKHVEMVDYDRLDAMLDAGPVYLSYDRDIRFTLQNLRVRGVSVQRRTKAMKVDGEVTVVTTLRKL